MSPKIYSTLKSTVTDWSRVTLKEALNYGTNALSWLIVSFAVLQLSGLAQKMDEDIPSYFTRGEELYKQAQTIEQRQTSPEKDKQFVLWLVNGLMDLKDTD